MTPNPYAVMRALEQLIELRADPEAASEWEERALWRTLNASPEAREALDVPDDGNAMNTCRYAPTSHLEAAAERLASVFRVPA